MSHLVKLKLQIKSEASLEKAVKKLGLRYNKGVKSFQYYGNSSSHCDATIDSEGDSRAVGVRRVGQGKNEEFELHWDPGYLSSKTQHALGGRNAESLKKEYAVAEAFRVAEEKGMYATRYDQKDGSVRVEVAYA